MGIFRPNLSEGKGVPEFEENESSLVYAWKTYWRHFIELLGLNICYLLFSLIPLVAAYFLTSESFWWSYYDSFFMTLTTESTPYQITMQVYPRIIFTILCVFIPLIQFGPIQCGATYVTRNISRRTHTFVWQDFIAYTFKNFKQALATTFINLFVTVFIGFAIFYWGSPFSPIKGAVGTFLSGFMFLVFLVFMSLVQYIYPLMVSYKMTIKEIYVASYHLAMSQLWKNLLFIFVTIAIMIVAMMIHIYLLVALVLFVLPVTILFINTYTVDKAVQKYATICK